MAGWWLFWSTLYTIQFIEDDDPSWEYSSSRTTTSGTLLGFKSWGSHCHVAKALTPCLLVIFPIFDAWKKSGFWSKEIFFFHILQVQSWRISRIQVFPDLPKTLQRVDGRILVFPDVLTVNSTYFLSQLPGSERTWAQWDAENHHFNWWQINYWIDWTFITFYSWFIAIMYSYSNLKCLQHSITNY